MIIRFLFSCKKKKLIWKMLLNKNKSILSIDFKSNLIHCVSNRRIIHIIHARIALLQLLILAILLLCHLHLHLRRRWFLLFDICNVVAYEFKSFFILKSQKVGNCAFFFSHFSWFWSRFSWCSWSTESRS